MTQVSDEYTKVGCNNRVKQDVERRDNIAQARDFKNERDASIVDAAEQNATNGYISAA